MFFKHQFKHSCTQVDLATARPEDLHTRIVHFGEKHVGSTFQEAMADPAYMSYVLQWMVPKTFEEKVFKRYVDMVLENHKPKDTEVFL
jgi:hypothetical protein